jgi:uncharacterized protein (DUF1697 family)
MTTYISLLRGINVSGQKKINMNELRKLYESLNFKNVRTYIQSGNVIFSYPNTIVSRLINIIKQTIKNTFGFDVSIIIRTKDDFQKLIKNIPFANKDISKRHVTFLSDTPHQLPIDDINSIKDKSEEFFISGKEIYLFCPNGYGRSKLSNNFFERTLKLSATTRNWKTVVKLLEVAKL